MPRTLTESEYDAIREEIIRRAPPNLSEAEFTRYAGPAMEMAIGIAENTPAPLRGSAMSRALGGLWQNINPLTMVSGLAQAVQHPVDTAAALYQAQRDQFAKAAEAPTLSEKAGYTAAGLLPILGPMAAHAGERGAQGDIAGMAGETAGLVAPFAVDAAMTLRPGRAARATRLEQEASQQVAQRVLAPGNRRYVGQAEAIAPEVLRRGMTGDRLALREAADAGMDAAGQAIDDAIAAAGGAQASVQVASIMQQLRSALSELTTNGRPIVGAEGRVSELRARIGQIQRAARNGTISLEELKKIRDVSYDVAARARGYERAGNVIAGDAGWAARETGGAIRQELANAIPDLASSNADYAFFKTLDDILNPAIGRPKTTTPSQGVTGGARTTGAVAGAMTDSKLVTFVMSQVVPWLKERAADPSWQLADAHRKMRLAQALRRGNVGLAKRLMLDWGKYGRLSADAGDTP